MVVGLPQAGRGGLLDGGGSGCRWASWIRAGSWTWPQTASGDIGTAPQLCGESPEALGN